LHGEELFDGCFSQVVFDGVDELDEGHWWGVPDVVDGVGGRGQRAKGRG